MRDDGLFNALDMWPAAVVLKFSCTRENIYNPQPGNKFTPVVVICRKCKYSSRQIFVSRWPCHLYRSEHSCRIGGSARLRCRSVRRPGHRMYSITRAGTAPSCTPSSLPPRLIPYDIPKHPEILHSLKVLAAQQMLVHLSLDSNETQIQWRRHNSPSACNPVYQSQQFPRMCTHRL